jgi:mycothiol synthase
MIGPIALTTSPELFIRNFEWVDIAGMSALLGDLGPHGHRDWPAGRSDLQLELEFPRVQPEKNVALAFVDEQIAGYAIVEPEQNIGRSVIGLGVSLANTARLPMNDKLGAAAAELLLDWAVGRASEMAPVAHLATRDGESGLRDFVEQHGWKRVRKYLKLSSELNPSPAAAVVPAGFTVRTMLGLDELPELTYLQNESFRTHFGYSPNTEDEIKARLLAPGAGVDDVVMIHDVANSDKRLVAYCWIQTSDRAGSTVGRIGMTGVLPDAQGHGLGRAIAESGFNHLLDRGVESIELDVDSTNAPAIKIYTSLGFTAYSEIDWWEKRVQG